MADDVHKAQPHDLLLHRKRHGEEQFVVLAAVERRNDRIGVHLLAERRSLLRDGDAFEVDAGAAGGGLAELHQIAGQTVREVDHRRGDDPLLGQRVEDVGAGAGLEVFFEQVFVSLELRLGICHVGEHALLAFEQAQPHEGGPEIARDADEVVQSGPAAVNDPLLRGVSQRRDGDRKAGHRGARVAAREVHAQLVAGEADAFVEVVERLDGQFRGDAERQDDLRRAGVHGQNVAHSGRHDLVAQVFEREVGEVEIHAFEEGVGRAEQLLARGGRDDGGVVADAPQGRRVLRRKAVRQAVDQSELSERGDLGAFLGLHVRVEFSTKLTILCRFSKISVILSVQSQKRIRI